ncbi:maleylpyruvate isomerase N-terminal domain-containing protein [Streptosporangium roseum]|uniref:Mycothiol-dependent maleylpyruvate isomerase metal-binding domain-containing protein n=1 Tax=Streptosporangium roseum (strain ATCC 12428 / DSM 43021 / JCM 3005 / KCTC 9067 / NCIMB 10171 / NRRL 2505 / NI 9100) TaxID=479432 RepID=D2BBT2_STRRD|nr:maleylpyruvate isomerase N-terminal domain-containing protein [Streptosporangium roseum]ACZ86151.1 hypothetical protein Sros_3208 [Streptosporangium roseum DSM 43021]
MDANTVLQTAAECRSFLESGSDRDWEKGIPGMEWTVAQAVAHISDTLLWYATDFAAGQRELSTMDLRVRPESSPADLAATLGTFATVVARVVQGAPAGARGWHPYGMADASGFAGMSCDELLMHTYDASLGLELPFTPSAELSEATLRRLFPWAPHGADPWRTLLWANGRADLSGHPRRREWRWHCAPLAEWDGAAP